jgi:plastocyanin
MLSKSARFWFAILIAVALLSLAPACGKKSEEEEEEGTTTGTTAGTKYTPTGNEGTVSGTIAFNGVAPEQRRISMDADPRCAQNNPNPVSEEVIVKNGKLQNVFIYIKDGTTSDGKKITDLVFDVPSTPVILDQKGCHYTPHVVGIQTGQKLNVTNSDPTTHNINVQPKNNQGFNQAQSEGQAAIVKTFARAETLIPVKCNQHPWMKAYINVLKHPFFAVSGEDGKYEFKGVPPGTYTVVAWHERYGEKTQQVKIDPKGSATVDFTFDAGAASNGPRSGSLEVLPALELPAVGHH